MNYNRLPAEIWYQILNDPALTFPDICHTAETCRDARWGIPKERASDAKLQHLIWHHPQPIKVCVQYERSLLGTILKAGRKLSSVALSKRRSTLSTADWLKLSIGEVASLTLQNSFIVDVSCIAQDVILGYLRTRQYLHAYIFIQHPSLGHFVVNSWTTRKGNHLASSVMQLGIDAYIFFRCALAKSSIDILEHDVERLTEVDWPIDDVKSLTCALRMYQDGQSMTDDQTRRPKSSDIEDVIEERSLPSMFRWVCSRGKSLHVPTERINANFISTGWIEGLCCFGITDVHWHNMRRPVKPYIKMLSPGTSYEGLTTLNVILGFTAPVAGYIRLARTPQHPSKLAFATNADQLLLDWVTFDSDKEDVWDVMFLLLENANYVAFQQLWLKVQPIQIPESKVANLINLTDTIDANSGTRDILMGMLMMVE